MQHLNVSLVQYDIIWEDSNANLEYLDTLLETARGSDLIILPEMFNTGFSMMRQQWLKKMMDRLYHGYVPDQEN